MFEKRKNMLQNWLKHFLYRWSDTSLITLTDVRHQRFVGSRNCSRGKPGSKESNSVACAIAYETDGSGITESMITVGARNHWKILTKAFSRVTVKWRVAFLAHMLQTMRLEKGMTTRCIFKNHLIERNYSLPSHFEWRRNAFCKFMVDRLGKGLLTRVFYRLSNRACKHSGPVVKMYRQKSWGMTTVRLLEPALSKLVQVLVRAAANNTSENYQPCHWWKEVNQIDISSVAYLNNAHKNEHDEIIVTYAIINGKTDWINSAKCRFDFFCQKCTKL